MKKYIIAIFACCWAIFSSCSDDDKLPNINPAATGEYTDERDGEIPTDGYESAIWNG